MTIRLLTFDLDHTLWNPDAAIRAGEHAGYCWLAERVPAFAAKFSEDAFLQFRMQLRSQHPELAHRVSEIRRVASRAALSQLGVPDAEAAVLTEQAFAAFWQQRQQVTVFAETPALLASLASHYTLAAVSNGNACLQAIGLADYFAFQLSGDNFAAAKPAPDMFLAALQRAGVAPQEALHIGDHVVDDMQAARAVGMHCLWVNLAGKTWPAEVPPPDYSVTSLPQILHIL